MRMNMQKLTYAYTLHRDHWSLGQLKFFIIIIVITVIHLLHVMLFLTFLYLVFVPCHRLRWIRCCWREDYSFVHYLEVIFSKDDTISIKVWSI